MAFENLQQKLNKKDESFGQDEGNKSVALDKSMLIEIMIYPFEIFRTYFSLYIASASRDIKGTLRLIFIFVFRHGIESCFLITMGDADGFGFIKEKSENCRQDSRDFKCLKLSKIEARMFLFTAIYWFMI